MLIRDARLEDVPALENLYTALTATFHSVGPAHATTAHAVGMRMGYYRQIIGHGGGNILVAEDDGTIVGVIACEYRTADEAFQWREMVIIQDLYVEPTHRTQGVAKQLCDAAFARCKADGKNIAYIWMAPTNQVMLDQSAQWGFQTEFVIKTKLL